MRKLDEDRMERQWVDGEWHAVDAEDSKDRIELMEGKKKWDGDFYAVGSQFSICGWCWHMIRLSLAIDSRHCRPLDADYFKPIRSNIL